MNTEHALKHSIAQQLISDFTPVIGVMDFDALTAACQTLTSAFPKHFQHHFAAKANPLIAVLTHIKANGLSVEVASVGERAIVEHAGFTGSDIVLDSPTKTRTDLHNALRDGISLNLDNLQELARVDEIRTHYPNTTSLIGLRVNPQLGTGTIESTSTASKTSKFGQAIGDAKSRQAVIEAFVARPWLNMLHLHAGSQGFDVRYHVNGIRQLVDFANEINRAAGEKRITTIDIGGGLSVNFKSDAIKPTFAEFSTALKASVPELFTGEYAVKTEFGRTLCAKAGIMISRVEYTKTANNRRIICTHAGAHVMTRTAFLPESWPMRVSVYAPDGVLRSDNVAATDVAGPLCFSGDLVAKNRELPQSYPDDLLIVHDCGGYYFTNHFDYNCLPLLPVYAMSADTPLTCIRAAGTIEQVINDYKTFTANAKNSL